MNKTLLVGIILTAHITFGQTLIFTEDFQSGIPTTWEFRNLDGKTPNAAVSEYTSAYISKIDPEDSLNLTASSTSFFSPIGTANRWLITPPIVMGAYGNSIEWKAKSHDASYPETYLVLVSSTDSLEASFTDTIGYIIQEYADWTTRSVNLSAKGLDNQTIYVAFILQTNDGFKFYLDDVSASKEDPLGLAESANDDLSLKSFGDGKYEIVSNQTPEEVLVMDEMGRIVLQGTSKDIDLSQFKAGLYFVQATIDQKTFSAKLLR